MLFKKRIKIIKVHDNTTELEQKVNEYLEKKDTQATNIKYLETCINYQDQYGTPSVTISLTAIIETLVRVPNK